MNLSPVQTLRDRLQAVMVAGAPLAADDFRLARELEQFAPYEKTVPVLARLGQACRTLQAPDCPDRAGALLDAISLADAVLCTQATVEAPGQPEAVEGQGTQAVLAQAPYSVLSPLIQALTTSKEGGYNLVMETHENHPELFTDYRVQEALVKALGGSYPDLANHARNWLSGMGESVVPLLVHDFDPKGKKEMVRRVQTLSAIRGANLTSFCLEQLPEAEKDTRAALLYAMRLDENNADTLIALFPREKGPSKKAAGFALARMDSPQAQAFWEQNSKNRKLIMQYAVYSTTPAMSRAVAETMGQWLEAYEADPNAHLGTAEIEEMNALLPLLPGKSGPEICDLYRRMAARTDLDRKPNPYPHKDRDPYAVFHFAMDVSSRPFREAVAKMLWRSLVYYETPDLLELAEELGRAQGGYFLATSILANLLVGEPAAAWEKTEPLFGSEQVPGGVENRKILEFIIESFEWIEGRGRTCAHILIDDPAEGSNRSWRLERPFPQEPDGRWYQAVFRTGSGLGRLAYRHVPLDQPEICRMAGRYLYESFLRDSEIGHYSLNQLRRLGWTTCEGLGVQYCRTRKHGIILMSLQTYLGSMPGDRAAKQKEGRAVYDFLAKRKALSEEEMRALNVTIEKLLDEPFTNVHQFT